MNVPMMNEIYVSTDVETEGLSRARTRCLASGWPLTSRTRRQRLPDTPSRRPRQRLGLRAQPPRRSHPRVRSVLLETRAEDARAECPAARQQAEDDYLIGVGHEEVKDACFTRQDDFTHDLILGMVL